MGQKILTADLAVVGSGPAGLCAAVEGAKAGAKVILLDENNKPGGQLFKQIHKFFGSTAHWAGVRGFDIGNQLISEAKEAGVQVWLNTTVWGIFEDKSLGIIRADKIQPLRAKKIILATGAAEKVVSFPGWTLPGIMGAGAAQTMINIHRVLPGTRVLMVGSGNVGLIVSNQLLQAGAEVVAVVEIAPRIGGYQVHASNIRRAGVPILTSHTVKEALGEGQVETVTVTKVDQEWNPIPNTEKTFSVDTVCMAVGLRPLAEMAWRVGCRFMHLPELGGYTPIHDRDMESGVPGIYVAGDIAGVEEASIAIEEGRLAGISAAETLGYLSMREAEQMREKIRMRIKDLRLGPFGEGGRKSKQRIIKESGKIRNKKISSTGVPYIHEPKNTPGFPAEQRFKSTGVPYIHELKNTPGFPTEKRFKKGAVAVIECVEEIPCDPCQYACPHGAIKVERSITSLPILLEERCNGCGQCIPLCPAMAIFVVDNTFSDKESLVEFPYERLPLPKVGSLVNGVNREGRIVTKGRVIKVRNPKKYNRTAIVSIAVPKGFEQQVRGIATKGNKHE